MSDRQTLAFPAPAHRNVNGDITRAGQSGMELRDYFAAKAMHAWITRIVTGGTEDVTDEKLARWAYETADAMLAERSKASRT